MGNESIEGRLNTLFDEWRKKDIHNGAVFISDGVVNESNWLAADNKRILFVLKEAYSHSGTKNWSLTKWLSEAEDHSKIWKRVVEWTYGIYNTTETRIAKYSPNIYDENKDLIQRIAVLNLKKSKGKSRSNYDEIRKYARDDREEIKRETEIISPQIIVCGSTLAPLDEEVYDNKIRGGKKCDNWFYYTTEITGEEILVIDYYHPAVQWAALANYYAVANIYQQALLEKNRLERGNDKNGKNE